MGRRYHGEDITLEVKNYVSGQLATATSVTLKTRMNDGTLATSTPTEVETGVYQQIVRPNCPGTLYSRFEVFNGTERDIEEEMTRILPGGFADQVSSFSDYT